MTSANTPSTLPLRLHTYFRSSASYRVRIALNWKGLTYEPVFRHLRRDEQLHADYIAINPEGLLPALQHGAVTITQSLAIIEYLEETFPHARLLPVNPCDRACARALAQSIACEIHGPNNLRVTRYLRSTFDLEPSQVNNWCLHWIATGFAALEKRVAGAPGTARHLIGDDVTVADLCLVPQMYNARRLGMDLAPYPTLVTISRHLESLAAFAAALPEAQPDCDI